jgi:hypothetical protein
MLQILYMQMPIRYWTIHGERLPMDDTIKK